MTPTEIKKANNYRGPKQNTLPFPQRCEYCKYFDSFGPGMSRCWLIGYELERKYSINHNAICDKFEKR